MPRLAVHRHITLGLGAFGCFIGAHALKFSELTNLCRSQPECNDDVVQK